MNARGKLLGSGLTALILAVLVIGALASLYWPFQTSVQIVAPFIVVGILVAIGISAILAAFFLPVDMFEAPLTGAPRWADWLSVAAVAIAILGLFIAVALPGPLNPAAADPPFVSGYAVVTGCSVTPATTTFQIYFTNSGAVDASGVSARYVLYALNSTTQSYQATVPIGTVPARTSGSVAVAAPLACGPYGTSVSVAFTWS